MILSEQPNPDIVINEILVMKDCNHRAIVNYIDRYKTNRKKIFFYTNTEYFSCSNNSNKTRKSSLKYLVISNWSTKVNFLRVSSRFSLCCFQFKSLKMEMCWMSLMEVTSGFTYNASLVCF